MSRFDLGYYFSKSVKADEEMLARYKPSLKYLSVDVKSLEGEDMDECLVQIKEPLQGLCRRLGQKNVRDAEKSGLFSEDRSAYCTGARIFIDFVIDDLQKKINVLEERLKTQAVRNIERAEKNFEQLSPYHQTLLETMRNKPN